MPIRLSPIARIHALRLISLCNPDDIWSIDDCTKSRVPTDWIDAFRETYESNFEDPSSTIQQDGRKLNQYHGVRAIDIAVQAAVGLGLRLDPSVLASNHRGLILQSIRENIEEA